VLRDTAAGWGLLTRLLHWTMAALVLFMLGLGFYMVQIEDDLVDRYFQTQRHKSFGALVFALAIVRILWRAANRARPAHPPSMPVWQVRAATVSHVLIYVLMAALPLSGWLMASASPLNDPDAVPFQITNTIFGLFDLPDPFAKGSQELTDALKLLHLSLAAALAALLAVHALAALKHHFIDRDRVLRQMIRGR
jgi:cytochrome b561